MGNPGNYGAAARAAAAERREKAWELLKLRYTQRAIAKILGVSQPRVAQYQSEMLAELDKTTLGHADEWRKMELARLADIWRSLMADFWVDVYGPEEFDAQGKPKPRVVVKRIVNLPVVDRLIRVGERIAKLKGLDVDKLALTDPTGTKPYKGIDAALAALSKEELDKLERLSEKVELARSEPPPYRRN